ncbi:chromate transporter [Planococcus kocurii]|uniref:Chromate transporter n=1 Tax=Planococcus kocurii TaxID=1374 RepID=A0ABM5X0S5_9BACL|nr:MULTISPECIES: chromate transporter [Planococcus]ALS80226.1 chromate transporter [Planococcus kocurii]KAA0958972.1 chromate transporter [Planococcus sp. ANT_H30]
MEKQQVQRSHLKINKDLFFAFFRVGLLGFGGGPAAIPLFHREAVVNYNWMTEDEFGDTLALGNTMPGPIATKMAGYIGYRVNGIMGCLVALAASVIPTVILMIVLLGILQKYKDLEWVNSMSAAVVPVVGVMLAVMTWDFFQKSGKALGLGRAILFTAIAIILLELMGIHPAIVIVGILIVSFTSFKKGVGPK